MKLKAVSGIILTLLFIGMLAFDIQPVKASGNIYIRADGSVDPLVLARETDTIANTYMNGTVRTVEPPWTIWTRYHNYSEIVETLLYLNSTYPNIVDLFSIGKSWENRDIYCIRLTNESLTDLKPKVFFVGYHHAREPISAELQLYFVVHAATGYGVNAAITRMLDFSEIYVIVALNVDGFDAVEVNEWQRKNVHPYDDDGDGLLDEDPPDDDDGDGFIEIKPGGIEGIDDDGDDLLNEDWVGGVDLNRNYGYQWGATGASGSPYPRDEDYRGPTPFSEPETQVIRDLALQHTFKYAISFHSGMEGIGYPWCYTATPTPDGELFREVAGNLSDLVNAPFTQGGVLQRNSGTWADWMYGNRSTFALTCEIFTNESAWQFEGEWRKGVFQFYNPEPAQIETVILRWLPVFTYIANRTISEAYDLAVTNITLSKTIVGQGYNLDINVTIANEGDFTETFNVTAYANTTITQTQTIILTSGNSTIITFTWNTTGVLYGNYTISAYAVPVPGETDKTDNMKTDGIVWVKLDNTPPYIGTPSQNPARDNVMPDQEVKVSVDVIDAESEVKNVTLFCTINNGSTWENLTMNYNASTNLYEVTIPGQEAGTWVKFKIVAYDDFGNNATKDGTELYCAYQVIPELPSFLILPLFMIVTLLAIIIYRRKYSM